jgi:glycosyltransferase involved in cell wall biosynthesis
MQGRPAISLIVSCFNQQPWLELVLGAYASQRSDVPFELLVCDDGSADGTFEAIRKWSATTDLDVRYVWQPDLRFRLSRSRNNGIRCAQGEILVFVDGDTVLAPHFLDDHWQAHKVVNRLVCGKRDTVVVSQEDLARLDARTFPGQPVQSQHEQLVQERCIRSDSPWMACIGGNFSARRSGQVYFDEDFESWGSEDRDLAFRLFRSGLTPHLLRQSNAVQLRVASQEFCAMTHDRVVDFIRNKLLLQNKYPSGELAGSIALVRYCHYDSDRQCWCIGGFRHDTSAEDIFREFQAWSERAG